MTCICSIDTPEGYVPCPFHAGRERQAYERALADCKDNLLRHAADPVRAGTDRAEVLRLCADGLPFLYTVRAQEELARWRANPAGYYKEVRRGT